MLNIALCDDDKLHLEHGVRLIGGHLSEYDHFIDGFENAEALLKAMEIGDYIPDIAVLDIKMDGADGISLAKRLNELAPRCQIIFLTGYLDYAPDVYSVEHVYFVLKNEAEIRIGDALSKALEALMLGSTRAPSITARAAGVVKVIPVNRIRYIERLGRKTRIVMDDSEFVASQAPAKLIDEKSRHFIRCHQSFWVNIGRISTLKNDEFCLDDNTYIPISRTFRREARARFFEYLRNSF